MKIGSFSLIKELNTSLILNTVREKKSISRAEIAKLTGLTAATVTNITGKLIEYKLISETRFGKSNGGRKPIMLEFNGSGYHILGVVISRQEITVSLTDLNSNPINIKRGAIEPPLTPDKVLGWIAKEGEALIKESSKRVLGIGVSMEGLIDDKNGICVLSSGFGWKSVNINDYLSKRLKLPVFVNNDVKALAKGEELFGKGTKKDSFILLYISYGIGAALVNNGKIYRGNSNYACEVGHITLDINGPVCNCGNRGCFQALASGEALIEKIQSNHLDGLFEKKEITLSDISKKIKEGDKIILELIEKQAVYIGTGIANIINIFNPSEIIINGYISNAPDYIRSAIMKEIDEKALPGVRENTNVIFSHMEDEGKYKGAAGLFISRLFDNPEIYF
ncbi:MAG: ROK family transcriptional regulator [Ruminococcaceae bacterium]|nr:ROK family transcriptional regulator [Oscillospiraceae bacterium]